METRQALCPVCQGECASVSFPVGTPEEKWANALSGYIHTDCIPSE